MKNISQSKKSIIYTAFLSLAAVVFIIAIILVLFSYKNKNRANKFIKPASEPAFEEPIKDLDSHLASPNPDNQNSEEILNKLTPVRDYLKDKGGEGDAVSPENIMKNLPQPTK